MVEITPKSEDKGYIFRICTDLFPIGVEWEQISVDLRMSTLYRMRSRCRAEIDDQFHGWKDRAAIVSGLAQLSSLVKKQIIEPDLMKVIPTGSVVKLAGGKTWTPVGPYHVIVDGVMYAKNAQTLPLMRTERVRDPELDKEFELRAAVWVMIEAREGMTP